VNPWAKRVRINPQQEATFAVTKIKKCRVVSFLLEKRRKPNPAATASMNARLNTMFRTLLQVVYSSRTKF